MNFTAFIYLSFSPDILIKTKQRGPWLRNFVVRQADEYPDQKSGPTAAVDFWQNRKWRKQMASANNHIKSQKRWPAFLAAFLMTAVIALAILTLGANALLNKSAIPVQAASLSDQAASGVQVTVDQSSIDQLQSLVEQYKARELQYQSELQQAADQLDQTNAELQQYQGLVNALQESGIIQISQDGRVFLNRSFAGGGTRQFGEDD